MPRFFNGPLISLTLLAISLAGCSRDYRTTGLGSAYAPAEGGLANPVSASSAAAMLPASAGAVIQVSERRYIDGVAQEIVLAGDGSSRGENRIDVALRLAPQGDQVYDNLIPMQKPSDNDIARELEARFPGVDMQPVNVLLQNRYGPYGLAAGKRGNGERCIYAWQWIEDASAPASPRNSTLARAILSQPQPVSLRVRLCRIGVSADQLASLVDGIAIGAGMGNRLLPVLGQYGGGTDALSAAGGIGGQSFAGYQMPAGIAPVAPMPRQRLATRSARHAATRHKRRRHVAQPAQDPQYSYQPQQYAPAQPQAFAPVPQQLQRPVASQFGQPQPYPAQAVAQSPTAMPTAPHPLDQGLPPQAYAGPNGTNRPPVRIIPLTGVPGGAVYNAPATAAPAGAGRLLRDPVVSGPGI